MDKALEISQSWNFKAKHLTSKADNIPSLKGLQCKILQVGSKGRKRGWEQQKESLVVGYLYAPFWYLQLFFLQIEQKMIEKEIKSHLKRCKKWYWKLFPSKHGGMETATHGKNDWKSESSLLSEQEKLHFMRKIHKCLKPFGRGVLRGSWIHCSSILSNCHAIGNHETPW